jgi:ATP-binding cassette subfamily B protein
MTDTPLDAGRLAISGPFRLPLALWRAAEGRQLTLIAAVTLIGLAETSKLGIPWLFAAAVNAVQLHGMAGLHEAALCMLGVLGVATGGWMLHGPGRICERTVALHGRRAVSDAVMRHVLALGLAWHDRTHSGETIDRFQRATNALFQFAETTFIYIQAIISLVGPLIALIILSPITGLTAILGYAGMFAVLTLVDRRLVGHIRDQNAAERRYTAGLVDSLGNANTVITLGLEDAVRRTLNQRLERVFAPLARIIRINEAKWCAVDLINQLMRSGLVVLYGWLLWRDTGAVLIGSLVAAYQYTQQVGGMVGNMAANMQALVRYHTELGGLIPLLKAPQRRPAQAAIPTDWQDLAIDKLSFTFEGKDRPTLYDIQLDLVRGSRIALVGESGAGKSTLLGVLAGIRPPDGGTLAQDGKTVKSGLTRLGMLVPQEPQIFEGTIRHNITLGIARDDADVARACRIARFDRVAASMPEGLDSQIQERGANLSGGQRQRLGLARAIVAASRDLPLLLLDEPTSSLDPVTEAAMHDGLFAAFPETCIISSIHRPHLLARFDTVLVMAEGRIVDRGTPQEIVRRHAWLAGAPAGVASPVNGRA